MVFSRDVEEFSTMPKSIFNLFTALIGIIEIEDLIKELEQCRAEVARLRGVVCDLHEELRQKEKHIP